MSEKKDLMTSSGMSKSEFGSALVTEAQNRKQKERLEKSIEFAQVVLSSLEECDNKIEWFTGWKKTREAQLKALQNGDFSYDGYGSIIYNDSALNRK